MNSLPISLLDSVRKSPSYWLTKQGKLTRLARCLVFVIWTYTMITPFGIALYWISSAPWALVVGFASAALHTLAVAHLIHRFVQREWYKVLDSFAPE